MEGDVYFAGRDAEHGLELWRSDGTPGGTRLVRDIVAGKGSSYPSGLAAADGKLFFFASDMEVGLRLWSSDGTAGGTHPIADIPASQPDSTPAAVVAVGQRVFFLMPNSGGSTCTLWYSGGGTEGLVSLNQEVRPWWKLKVFKNGVIFTDASGIPWFSDGSPQGTYRLDDEELGLLVLRGEEIYLTGWESLRVSDGTPEGARTAPFWDERFSGKYLSGLSAHGEIIRFTVMDDDGVNEDWMSDGTVEGTRLVYRDGDKAPRIGWGESISFKGMTLMDGYSEKAGSEPWIAKGTRGSTHLLRQIVPGDRGSYPQSFVQTGNLAFFTADSMRYGREVWYTSGKGMGTRQLLDLRRGQTGSDPKELTVAGKLLFWTADDGKNGRQLWSSNGRKTRRLTSLAPGLVSRSWDEVRSDDTRTVGLNGTYFFSSMASNGYESLLRSDGSAAGTFTLSAPPVIASLPSGFQAVGDRVYFDADSPDADRRLWTSDGSVAGTDTLGGIDAEEQDWSAWTGVLGQLGGKTLLTRWKRFYEQDQYRTRHEGLWLHAPGEAVAKEVLPGAIPPGSPGEFVFFTGYDSVNGEEPWVSDGTLEGTRMIKDIRPPTIYDYGRIVSSSPEWLARIGDKVFFSADSFTRGRELWVTDGTAQGTQLVMEFSPHYTSSRFSKAYVWGSKLVFFVEVPYSNFSPITRTALWITDGSTEGTVKLADASRGILITPDFHPGAMFAEIGGKLVFPSSSEEQGRELWITDGTPAGTTPLKDIRPGLRGSNPKWITATGDAVYFTANDGAHGNELWRTDGAEAGTVMVLDPTQDAGSSAPWGLSYTGGKLFFRATTDETGRATWVIDEP